MTSGKIVITSGKIQNIEPLHSWHEYNEALNISKQLHKRWLSKDSSSINEAIELSRLRKRIIIFEKQNGIKLT